MTCSKKRKNACLSPQCEWVTGKGCRTNVNHKECPAGKEYNPYTKRCRKPCPPGKEYNPETKRCRKNRSIPQITLPPITPIKDICPDGKVMKPDKSGCKSIKFISSGTYGCVITPPIFEEKYIIKEDIPYLDRANDDISKIYKSKLKHYEKELEILEKVEQIDPHHKFTIKLKGAQHISGNALVGNRRLMRCLESNRSEYYQIILENGGKELFGKYEITFPNFLNLFKTFLEGMVILQNNKIVHRDIKPENVLITRKKLNLIDFGLYCYTSEVFREENEIFLNYKYPYYPPEFYVAYILLYYRNRYDGDIVEFHHYLNKVYGIMEKNRYFNQSYMNPQLRQTYISGVIGFIADIKMRRYKSYDEVFNEEMALKTDIFPLGRLITALNKNIVFSDQSEKDFVDKLYIACSHCNPYRRATLKDLIAMISNYSLKQTAGSKPKHSNRLKKSLCDNTKILKKRRNKFQKFQC